MSTETQLKMELPSHQRAAQLWTKTRNMTPATTLTHLHTLSVYITVTISAMYTQEQLNKRLTELLAEMSTKINP